MEVEARLIQKLTGALRHTEELMERAEKLVDPAHTEKLTEGRLRRLPGARTTGEPYRAVQSAPETPGRPRTPPGGVAFGPIESR